MRTARPFDPDLHQPGSDAARGACSWHAEHGSESPCGSEAVVSFRDSSGQWQSGCQEALELLVERGEIAPLGQGA